MNLRDKLKRLDRYNHNEQRQKNDHELHSNKLTDYIHGKIINSENGCFFHRQVKVDLNYKHGLYPLAQLTEFNNDQILNLINSNTDKNKININYNDMLFIDTETTGLMGGTGTVAFLVGIGYFQHDSFIVEQYFMRDFAEENAMLKHLCQKINRPALVSFNGKSFDWPLLKTRFIMHRLPKTGYVLHMDLLHLSRRIWSHLDSCRLSNLEAKILGFHRKDDIPGSEIPHIYFNYIQNKNPHTLPAIFKHNLLDIVSLVTLTTHLLKVHNFPQQLKLSAEELFNYGKLLQKRKEIVESIDLLEKARIKANSPVLKRKTDIKLSWQYKRAEKWEKAVIIWKEMLTKKRGGLFPYRELAKYFEHRKRDYKKAIYYTEEGMKYLKEHRLLFSNFREEKQKLEYRQDRLQRKIKKT